jgi:ferric-dicitrate binding protein FerR (iron transport regulator)
MSWKMVSGFCGVTTLVCLVAAASSEADPPGRVARVSFVSGSASFRPATLDEWSALSLNYPITIGDHIWTDNGSRTELEVGSAVLRVAPYTELSVLNLDDHTLQLRLTEGTVWARVRRLDRDEVVEIDTPNSAVSVTEPGVYRIDVSQAGDATVVTVRRGETQITTGDGATLSARERESLESSDFKGQESSSGP